MVRVPLSSEEMDRGRQLGVMLRAARGRRSMADVASAAEISVETLRKIETGRIPTPAFFTVAALANTLALSLDHISTHLSHLEAERAHGRARLRAEAEELRNDPDDVAASRELAEEMDAVDALQVALGLD